MKEELRDKILDVVRTHGGISVNALYSEVGGNRNTAQKAWEEMVKDKILNCQGEKNKKILTIKNTNFEKYFENFDELVKFDIDLANREILALREFKPVCKNLVKSEKIFTYWVNPKARPHLDQISDRVNMIFSRSASLTYAQTMNLIPKKYTKKIQGHNKKCLKAIKEIITKLMSEHKEYEPAMKNIISWSVYGYKMISQIEQLSDSKNKSFTSKF